MISTFCWWHCSLKFEVSTVYTVCVRPLVLPSSRRCFVLAFWASPDALLRIFECSSWAIELQFYSVNYSDFRILPKGPNISDWSLYFYFTNVYHHMAIHVFFIFNIIVPSLHYDICISLYQYMIMILYWSLWIYTSVYTITVYHISVHLHDNINYIRTSLIHPLRHESIHPSNFRSLAPPTLWCSNLVEVLAEHGASAAHCVTWHFWFGGKPCVDRGTT